MKPMIVTIEAIIVLDDDPIEFCDIVAEGEVVKIFVVNDIVDDVFGWVVVDWVVTIGEVVVGIWMFDHFAIPFAVLIVPTPWKLPPTNKLFDFVSKYIAATKLSTPFCIKS